MNDSRRNALDPSVASLLTEGSKRQEIRQKSRKAQAARSRYTYDLPERVQDAVVHVAEAEGLSASAVAALLLADALCRYRERRIVFSAPRIKRTNRSPKYAFVVDDDVILAVLRGTQSLEP